MTEEDTMTLTRSFTATHRRLCYETTRWQRFLFDARTEAGALGSAIGQTREILSEQIEGLDLGEAREDVADVAGEIYGRLYGNPSEREEDPEIAWAPKAHEILADLPEWDALRAAVAGDPDFSALATAEVLDALRSALPDLLAASEEGEESEDGEDGEGEPGEGEGRGSGSGSAPGEAEGRVRRALRKAIAKAGEEVSEGRSALAGLAPGMEKAPPAHEQHDPTRLLLAERLLASPRLRDVLRKAGRIARLSSSKRKQRDERSRSEVVDIERGADLSRILPASLARLRHPTLRKLALREIVERQAPQYRLEGKETLGRGPIVVMLDRSYSMEGEPNQWASAAAIALVAQGAREKRPVTVIEFTGHVCDALRVSEGRATFLSTSDPSVEIEGEKPLRSASDAALWLASSEPRGGTDFDGPLRYALRAGALDDRADFMFVTDGCAEASPETLAQIEEAKTRGLRIFGLLVNGGYASEAISQICTSVVNLDESDDAAIEIARCSP
jgi:uncharacterized protein with von Willebrand factor type A (vWA) domain